MNESQEQIMTEIIKKTTLSNEEWLSLYSIYNDTFNTEINYCESCKGQNENVFNKLKKLYENGKE